jgi:hypothetical protein
LTNFTSLPSPMYFMSTILYHEKDNRQLAKCKQTLLALFCTKFSDLYKKTMYDHWTWCNSANDVCFASHLLSTNLDKQFSKLKFWFALSSQVRKLFICLCYILKFPNLVWQWQIRICLSFENSLILSHH